MVAPPNRPPTVTALWIQHFAFANAAIIYGVVAYLAKVERTRPELADPVFYALIVVSLVLIFLGTRVPEMAARAPAGGETAAQMLARRQKQLVFMDVFLEAGGILALVTSFMGILDFLQLCVLLGISFLAMLGMAPRIRGWIEEYEAKLKQERVAS